MEQLSFFKELKLEPGTRGKKVHSLDKRIHIAADVNDLNVKARLSSSKITTYEGCKMAYYLKYERHEKVPESIKYTFGRSIHSMLENFYQKNYKSPGKFALQWFGIWKKRLSGGLLKDSAKRDLRVKDFATKKNGIVSIGNHINLGSHIEIDFNDSTEPDNKIVDRVEDVYDDYKNAGFWILTSFYKRHKGEVPPVATELSYGKRKNEIVKVNGLPFILAFDRIEWNNGKFCIVDYKTDRKSPRRNSLLVHRNMQFTLYSYVFRMLFEVDEEALVHYHLREGKPYETHRSQKDYDYLFRVIERVSDGIGREDFMPFYDFHCGLCDYYPVPCEKYSMDYYGRPRLDLEGRIKEIKEFDWEKFKRIETELPEWMMESE